jgi:hypothetical protein
MARRSEPHPLPGKPWYLEPSQAEQLMCNCTSLRKEPDGRVYVATDPQIPCSYCGLIRDGEEFAVCPWCAARSAFNTRKYWAEYELEKATANSTIQ